MSNTEAAVERPTFFQRFVWPNWQRRKTMLWREAWLVAILAYPLLAFAYLWPGEDWRNASPVYVLVSWAAFTIRVLQFHLGLLLTLILATAAIGRRWRLVAAAAAPMLLTMIPAAWQFVPRSQPEAVAGGQALRVMSVNLLMVNANTDGIIDEILDAKPDVLMLQEYSPHWHEAIQKAVAPSYPYNSFVIRDDSFGIAIYSRVPFIGEVDQNFPIGKVGVEQMRAEIDIGGKRVALYNIHLLPPRTVLYTGEHRRQFADLLDALKAEKRPYVVSGDFNFPETTAQHSALKRAGIREAHELAGSGRGATWPVNGPFRYIVPGIRIDHVYLSELLTATKCETGIGAGSDHRPVLVEVAFTQK